MNNSQANSVENKGSTENAIPATKLRQVSLDDKYSMEATRAYLTGIEALVRLPILQHQRDMERGLNTAGFVSGYRGSPLGSVDQAMWKAKPFLDQHNIKFTPGVNEELAATAVRGSQEVGLIEGSKYDGVFGMWYGKGPGLDRSIDAFRHANASGTSQWGGVLAVVGDDHGCKSSTYPYQSEHLFMSLSMPILAPANVQEVLDLGIFGWELSRYSGCWVGLKAITENMDSAISAEIDPGRVSINIPTDFEMPEDGVNIRWPDNPMAQEERLNKFKIYAALAFARANEINKIIIDTPTPKLGIVTTGKSYLDVLQAFDDLGITEQQASEIGIRVYKVGMPWPLEPVKTHEFASGLTEILVVEEKRSVIEDQLTGQLYNWPVEERPRVVGEYDEQGKDLLTNLGELTPAMIARVIAERLKPFFSCSSIEERVAFINQKERDLLKPRLVSHREAMFCSGCPHNTSTQVPEGSIAGGGIGCHYLATRSKTRPAHGFTQMGGEGTNWVGVSPFTETEHIFQNLGDGTYFHSGVLAIRQAVAAGVNITYKILYNDAVAMTGGQSIDGSLSIPELLLQLRGEGVSRIELVTDDVSKYQGDSFEGVTISHRDNLMLVQESMRETKGCSVLVYEQTCATEKRRRKKRGQLVENKPRIFINESVCEGCGDCSAKSNCLSVVPNETALGRKRKIDQAACNFDHSCVKGFCPSFVSVEGALSKPQGLKLDGLPQAPAPQAQELVQPWNVVIAGVGGTGVLTVTSVLSMAAHLESKGVATMNQTGLAQKFGPVVSHLRIANRQRDIHAVRIPAGDADLILGIDLLVSASDDALAKMHTDRTWAVVNESITPTAEFVENPDVVFHVEPMKQSIRHELSDGRARFLKASEMATGLLGNSIATNFFLVGYAFQQGLIPLSAEAIHEALKLNGVQIEFNQQAFEWGRQAYLQDNKVSKLAKLTSVKPKSLDEMVDYRFQDLVAYQDQNYANRYRNLVEKATVVDTQQDKLFSQLLAQSYYKVLAIKDEYEVARLYSDGRFESQLKEQFQDISKMKIYLAPPLFSKRDKRTGHLQKRAYGKWVFSAFRFLAKMKRLRGTALDVFGYTQERKMERSLIEQFESVAQELIAELDGQNYQAAIEVLRLFLEVRGFGHVKEQNYQKLQNKLELSLLRFRAGESIQTAASGLSAISIEVEKPAA